MNPSTGADVSPHVLLSRTSPGTEMGALFRRYWLPVMLATELPEPDCPPVRTTLLSEKLIAFRDTAGRYGLIDEFCAHRGVSLWFGRNEEDGIRCAYHGWKYDVSGQCTEIPSEPAKSRHCDRIRLKSYPLIERGGILWAYMGPPDLQPTPPEFEFANVPAPQRLASKRLQSCNYLQALEGGMDPFHLAFLHRGEFAGNQKLASPGVRAYMRPDLPLRMETQATEGGLLLANGREGDSGVFWRVMQWVLPAITLIPPFGDSPVHGHAWVPIDDDNCWVWTFEFHPTRALTADELRLAQEGDGLHVKLLPGSFLPASNRDNHYFMDRTKQKAGVHYSGVEGIGNQDAALQENMAPIEGRKEHLVSIDRFIVQARRRLLEAARALDASKSPPGVDGASQQVRSVTVILGKGEDVFAAVKEATQTKNGEPFVTA